MAKAKKGISFVRTVKMNGVEYPIRVTVYLIKGRRNFKAVVKLDYFGILLNDIRILEDFQGNTIVVFPTREHTDKNTNETREFNVFIPSQKLRGTLNNLIVTCYLEAVEREGPFNDLLRKDSIANPKRGPKKTRKAVADETVNTDAAESEQAEEPAEEAEGESAEEVA